MKNYILWFGFLALISSCQGKIEHPAHLNSTTQVPYNNNTPAALLAQEQLDAYNRKDIEAFLFPFSDSVKVYNTLTELGYVGKERMRQVYTNWFAGLDSLNCQLVNRITSGNTIIDHEKMTYSRVGLDAIQTSEAIAIYKIRGDKIEEVYFTTP